MFHDFSEPMNDLIRHIFLRFKRSLFGFFILLSFSLSAQQLPPSVPDIDAERWRSGKDYSDAAWEWQTHYATFPMSSADFLNWFKALYIGEKYFTDFKSKQNELYSQRQVLDFMGLNHKESFENDYASYLYFGKTQEGFTHLRSAADRNGKAPEIQDDLLLMHYVNGDLKAAQHSAILAANSKQISDSRLDYAFNVLSSIELNGALITQGCSDTYPLIMVQLLNGYRPDILIIPLEYLTYVDFASTIGHALNTTVSETNSTSSLLRNNARPTYIACTVQSVILKKRSNNLYCTGLAFKYSETPLLNMPTLLFAWSELFRKDNIKSKEPQSRNYLPMLIQMANYYYDINQREDADRIKRIAIEIADLFGIKQNVLKQFH